ncbi:uncharacterized protein PAC_11851 [Phialocephala subalpina]|uniref:Uncharacterized protein n=1 Tax=Phialocephala subalpina TaxID=576137 RepID=A0A1L7XAA4_9HELO|nr:uncharacterized protein PAC_11851 [Phialocephala subalpina]
MVQFKQTRYQYTQLEVAPSSSIKPIHINELKKIAKEKPASLIGKHIFRHYSDTGSYEYQGKHYSSSETAKARLQDLLADYAAHVMELSLNAIKTYASLAKSEIAKQQTEKYLDEICEMPWKDAIRSGEMFLQNLHEMRGKIGYMDDSDSFFAPLIDYLEIRNKIDPAAYHKGANTFDFGEDVQELFDLLKNDTSMSSDKRYNWRTVFLTHINRWSDLSFENILTMPIGGFEDGDKDDEYIAYSQLWAEQYRDILVFYATDDEESLEEDEEDEEKVSLIYNVEYLLELGARSLPCITISTSANSNLDDSDFDIKSNQYSDIDSGDMNLDNSDTNDSDSDINTDDYSDIDPDDIDSDDTDSDDSATIVGDDSMEADELEEGEGKEDGIKENEITEITPNDWHSAKLRRWAAQTLRKVLGDWYMNGRGQQPSQLKGYMRWCEDLLAISWDELKSYLQIQLGELRNARNTSWWVLIALGMSEEFDIWTLVQEDHEESVRQAYVGLPERIYPWNFPGHRYLPGLARLPHQQIGNTTHGHRQVDRFWYDGMMDIQQQPVGNTLQENRRPTPLPASSEGQQERWPLGVLLQGDEQVRRERILRQQGYRRVPLSSPVRYERINFQL